VSQLKALFAERFGKAGPTHLVTAPGRVNLMGEHIDYLGLSVLPMALQRSISLTLRGRDDDLVQIANRDGSFGSRSFALNLPIQLFEEGDWGNYVKAAARGLLEKFGSLGGVDVAVESTLPIEAGLSSSSALVVGVALAMLTANGIEVEPLELADLMASAERYVGLRGGGMDQAVCLGARSATACRIDFDPLCLTHVRIPPQWRFVIASSLIPARKSAANRDAYNERTEQCQQALSVMVRGLEPIGSYAQLLANGSGMDLLRRAERVMSNILLKRFRHVVTERDRVLAAEEAMRAEDISQFGRLMTQSHDSLRDDFEVSCPELNDLVHIAMSSGAVGARLTGAGFGGCVVALCASTSLDDLLEALKSRFYVHRRFDSKLEHYLFAAQPSTGASVRPLS